ncbi:flocculation protein FLO11-like isoform X2 [Patiria miniata]|uniref:Vasculin n=1 Tax=Patiria miniata TaxID=46514 RepID=A0A914AUP3_PATMI|nr:flocculation protein FLO11-like isoform X2 [Patiria miniata]
MVLADMANPPEHDFAPAWLKIPSHQQSSKPPLVNYSGHGGRPGPPDEHPDRYKSRHYSTDSQYGYGRSPTHDQSGFRGRDENRQYSNANNRHHSVDSLPWDPDPTTHWNLSQFNGNSSGTCGTSGYPRRGNSVPRNGHQQYSNNGRFDGNGFASSRGPYQQGKPAGTGRQRYNSGPKSGYSELEDHSNDTPTKEEGQGEGADDAGKESDTKSALSNQDFPSLSGTGDDVETSATIKKSIPSGAWEKPPGTNTKVISGRKLQLIKKSIPSASETKSTPRTIAPSSTSTVDPPVGSKVIGQNGSSGQTSKLLVSSNGSSSVVLKSMTSVTPMVSSRSKDSAIRSAPVPSSRISPVPSKPSPVPSKLSPVPILNRSTPTDINPLPVKVQSNTSSTPKALISKAPISKSPVSKPASPASRPSVVSSSSALQEAAQVTADVGKAASSADSSSPRVTSTSIASEPVVKESSKNEQPSPKPISDAPVSTTTNKPTSTTKASSSVTPSKTPVSKSSTQSSSKPTSITNMSSTFNPAKPTSNPAKPTSNPAKPTSNPAKPTFTPAKPTFTPAKPTSNPAKPTSIINMATLTPAKPVSITNMSTLTPTKPTSITNMSSTLNSKQNPSATRLAISLNRPTPVVGRSAPVFGRPSPVSSTRPSMTIINRQIPAPTGTSGTVPVSLRSGPAGSLNSRKEKSVTPVHTSTMKLLTKEPPSNSPLPTPTAPLEMPCPSPTTPKPKKGDKLVFLNKLRRSSIGDLSKEVTQNNEENLRENDANFKMNGPTTQPKRIMKREHHDIKTNGIDIHHDFTTFEKGSEEDNIPNFYPVFSPVKDVPDMSSSLEAEKRLLQEMGWHEHSDNEEGYAPLTEDELKEFKKRSQQVKKNGLTRALPATWNSVSLPICSMAQQVSLDDGLTSSDSDSSDDEQG